MANKYLKKFSISLYIKEMKIKTTLRLHLTPVRITVFKNTNNKCQQRCREIGTLIHCWWEYKLVQPLWKTIWRLLEKLKIELPYDLGTRLHGIYPKEFESLVYPCLL
jgi:hypothetical protein